MLSTFLTVLNLCAIIKTVLPLKKLLRLLCIIFSFSASREVVYHLAKVLHY